MPQPAQRKAWYGWQILIGDGVSLGLAILTTVNGRFEIAAGVAGAYMLNGPIVHASHGRPVLASLGLRAIAPAIFAATIYGFSSVSDEPVGAIAYVISAVSAILVTGVAASGIDIALLAKKPVPTVESEPSEEQFFSISPSAAPLSGGGAAFGFVGRF